MKEPSVLWYQAVKGSGYLALLTEMGILKKKSRIIAKGEVVREISAG